MEVGDSIDRYVRVINDNPETVKITLSTSGDLADEIKLKDESFELKSGEEKNAYFSYKARKAGNYNSRINVQFSPLEEGKNGVGLASTVIINVLGEGEIPKDENQNNESDSNVSVSVNLGSTSNSNEDGFTMPSIKPEYFLGISTLILVGIFGLLVYFYYKKESYGNKIIGEKVGVMKKPKNAGKK